MTDRTGPEAQSAGFASRMPIWRRSAGDAAAAIVLIAVFAVFDLVTISRVGASASNVLPVISGDFATYFLPWFDYLGQSLRSGLIPAWAPHQFAGQPFVGDPQAGWMLLPVMIFFAALPLGWAVLATILLQQALLAGTTYAFARLLGLSPVGALTATLVYGFALFWAMLWSSPQFTFIMAWAPLMLLAAELSFRANGPLAKLGWWLLGGLAFSQELAVWTGQGSFYLALLTGGWIVFRTLFWPVEEDRPFINRLGELVLTAAAIFGSGLLLNAAALLPRLEFNAVSNIPGGVYIGPEGAPANVAGGVDGRTMFASMLGGYQF
ncbi:MAG: hypothetical protein ACR2J8_06200, partial [Thermomicrobiales bacterium]